MLTEGVDERTKPSVIIKSKLTDHQMKLEAASLASSSGLYQKGIYAEETQQKLFSRSEPKPRKDKSVMTATLLLRGLLCHLHRFPVAMRAAGDSEKQRETSASGARNTARCLQQSPFCPRDENHQLVASVIFC